MDNNVKALLEKQQYRFAGKHTAVKICSWTKKSIRDEGVCYKQQFYGINSHRCVQMSPSVGFCQNRCIFCWRPLEYSEGMEMDDFDSPEDVIDRCIDGQRSLLAGFGGNDKADRKKLEESMKPLHFAISLTGEPTLYPKLNKLIRELHSRGYSTFVVTNAMEPDVIRGLEPPTQLYFSVDAPDEELFKKIDQPLLPDGWKRLNESLSLIPELNMKTRTCMRFTIIKGLNMVRPEEWAGIINKYQPRFVEVKAYMFVGCSKDRMDKENMPRHEDIRAFTNEMLKHTDYRLIDEHERSRVTLLMKEDFDGRVMDFGS